MWRRSTDTISARPRGEGTKGHPGGVVMVDVIRETVGKGER